MAVWLSQQQARAFHVLFGPNAATTSSAFYIILSYLTELLVRFIGGGDNVTMNILLLWKSVL